MSFPLSTYFLIFNMSTPGFLSHHLKDKVHLELNFHVYESPFLNSLFCLIDMLSYSLQLLHHFMIALMEIWISCRVSHHILLFFTLKKRSVCSYSNSWESASGSVINVDSLERTYIFTVVNLSIQGHCWGGHLEDLSSMWPVSPAWVIIGTSPPFLSLEGTFCPPFPH